MSVNMPEIANKEELSKAARERIALLWSENKPLVGWFVREDFRPRTDEDYRFCASRLRANGTLDIYRQVRELEQWL